MALRRPYVFDESVYIPAPVGGWNPDANPWEVPSNQAPILDNALVRPGRVVVRGSLVNWADLSSITLPAPPLNVGGVQPLPGSIKLAIGRKAVSSTAYVDPWFAPIVRPAAAATLAAPTADMAVAFGGTTLTNTAFAANLIPGPRGISFEGTRYYLSYGAATAGVADAGGTFFASPVALCTLSAAGTPSAMTNAPRGGIDIKGYQSRIWMLGGIDDPASGTTFNPLRLLFTNPIGPGGGNAASYADWKDPTTGLTNQILMDGDTTDPGVGMAVVRNGLLIFRASSIWILRGTTSASYTLQPVTRQVGCVDPRSIIETDNGTFFMSRQGLMLTDGVVVRNVSGTALNTLQQAVSLVSGAIKSSFGGYITGAVTSGGQLVLSMGVASVTAGAPDGHLQPVWAGMFDPAQNAWIRITSTLFAADGTIVTPGNNYPGWVFNTPDLRLLSIGDKYITQWESEFASSSLTTLTASAYAGSAAQTSTGKQSWLSTSPATGAPDATQAIVQAGSPAPTNSEFLQLTGYGFSIPAAATITGVTVQITGFGGAISTYTNSLQLLKAGVASGTAKSDLTHAWSTGTTLQPPTQPTWGSSSDLWGAALIPADINNSGFGVALQLHFDHNSGNSGVDAVQITVYYTLTSATSQQSFIKQPALYDKDAAGNFQPIPFRWRTQLYPIVGTDRQRKLVQLKRFFVDYLFQGLALPSANGFTVTPVDDTGTLLPGSTAVQLAPTNNSMSSGSVSGGPPIPVNQIERQSIELNSEATDMAMDLTWADAQQASQPSAVAAEIYGVGIDALPGRPLHDAS